MTDWSNSPEFIEKVNKEFDERFRRIVLPWDDNRQVILEIIGDLGLEYDDDGWEVYHIPTLTRFNKAVPARLDWELEEEIYQYDRGQLLNWMKKVQESNLTAWTMLRLLTPQNYKDKGEKAKEIIQAWCLSVKVE